ncbi:hypothetical protein ABE099_05585 [Paenibacillus turicensis]|uniref:hypothetical protein n=1 Tax=Paenibacillus turicensis TaxID=160487 RepID=UPI003D2E0CEE
MKYKFQYSNEAGIFPTSCLKDEKHDRPTMYTAIEPPQENDTDMMFKASGLTFTIKPQTIWLNNTFYIMKDMK